MTNDTKRPFCKKCYPNDCSCPTLLVKTSDLILVNVKEYEDLKSNNESLKKEISNIKEDHKAFCINAHERTNEDFSYLLDRLFKYRDEYEELNQRLEYAESIIRKDMYATAQDRLDTREMIQAYIKRWKVEL